MFRERDLSIHQAIYLYSRGLPLRERGEMGPLGGNNPTHRIRHTEGETQITLNLKLTRRIVIVGPGQYRWGRQGPC